MPYIVRRTLKPRLVPKMRLAGLARGLGVDPRELLARLEERLERAHAELGPRDDIADEDFNAIVLRYNPLHVELSQSTGEVVPERLEAEAAEVIAAFDVLTETGQLPEGWVAGPERKIPWLMIGLGVAAVAGLALWARSGQGAVDAALIERALATGELSEDDLEDCGCGG